jgi:hypothetical protein
MRELISPPAILVKDTGTDKGRAVYANREFLSGDLVEGCPVIIVRFDQIPPEIKRIALTGKVSYVELRQAVPSR